METIKEFLENYDGEIDRDMEQLMAKHLPYCLTIANFLKLRLSSLCRIFETSSQLNIELDQLVLINFCFRLLDAQGFDASLMFVFIKVSQYEEYFLDKLMENESKFDFAFLKPWHIKYLFNQNKELKKLLSKSS